MTPFESLPTGKLSKESEALLAVAIRKGSKKAAEKLVLSSLREAVVYGKQFYGDVFSDSELMSVCYGVLRSSAQRFDPSRQRFIAFCKCGIRGAIKRHWQTLDPVRNASVKRRKDGYSTHEPAFMDFDFICQTGGTPSDPDATNEPLGIANPDWDGMHARERSEVVWEKIKNILNQREELILFLRYDSGFNYGEIGSLLGISRTLVQELHKKAVETLRDKLKPLEQLIRE